MASATPGLARGSEDMCSSIRATIASANWALVIICIETIKNHQWHFIIQFDMAQ
jgi:hypothetical protein